jgi:hypothetical protein
MYGKSYDGLTGLIGVDKRPAGLAAVVSQEPVYDDYRYLYGDGMRRSNSGLTPALYDGIAATPGPLTDDPNYNVNSLNDPVCLGQNFAAQAANDDHGSEFWKLRNLIPGAAGSKVPLFLTQGLTENNTVADGLQQYLDNHTGYERAWLGPWEHVRGNETDASGRLKMGRAGWFDETMRFYDLFLKGIKSRVKDPMIAVQTNDGKWRAENTWPPADSTGYTSGLRPGSYTDEADGSVTDSDGVWTISPPLPYDAHLSGSGHATVNVSTTLPRANLVVDVYDLDRNGTGPLITRQAHMIYGTGDSKIPLDLWSADWKIAAGHRIGIKVADNNTDFWLLAAPTMQTVTVTGGALTLPFLGRERTTTIQGDPGTQLDSYLSRTVTVPSETIESSESGSFGLPPRQKGDTTDGTVTAGPAQSPVEGSVVTKAPGVVARIPGVTSEFFEFDVDAVHDNASMQGRVTPTLPADIDLYLQRRNDDGSWSEFADGTNGGALDGETIGTSSLTPGHYRLEVHNWAGPPGNQVAIKLTFLNSAGEPGI